MIQHLYLFPYGARLHCYLLLFSRVASSISFVPHLFKQYINFFFNFKNF